MTEAAVRLREAVRLLEERYGNRTNSMNVGGLDTALHVLLAVRSTTEQARRVFAQIKMRWPTWDQFEEAQKPQKLGVLRPLGMAEMRLSRMEHLLMEARHADGSGREYSLEYLNGLGVKQVLRTLQSYSGIGPKVARCVALYAWRMRVCPLDTHGMRVLRRLGVISAKLGRTGECEIQHSRRPPDEIHTEVEALLELGKATNDQFYSLHMNLMAHGRAVCTSKNPRCGGCPLRKICPHGRNLEG